MEIWHCRLCHQTLDDTAVTYISFKVRDIEVSNTEALSTHICEICAMGRQHKEAAIGVQERADDILQVIHTDLYGPMQTVGLSGERYFITFIDECSGRVSLSLLHSKDEPLTVFQTYQA